MEEKRKTRVLMIENDPGIYQWMKSRLESENIELLWIPGSTQALRFLDTNRVDIIILDLILNDGNGFEILKYLKKSPLSVPVYIFSLNRAMQKFCLRNGANGFYDKSEDGDVLVDLLNGRV